MAYKYFKVGLEEELYEKFLTTCTGEIDRFLVDKDGNTIAEPTEADIAKATAKRDAEAKQSVMQMMIRNGMAASVRNCLTAQADVKMRNADETVNLEGIREKKALQNFSIPIEEL